MARTLARTLGLRDLTFIAVGAVVGSGVFIVPAVVLAQTGGTLGASSLVWLLGGVLSLLGALTFAELGAQRPAAGGMYTFIRDAFGAPVAFVYGWTTFVVIATGAVAAMATAFAQYAEAFVPLGPWGRRLIAVAMIAVVTFVNVRGTRKAAGMQIVATFVKAGAVLVLGLLLVAMGDWGAGNPPPLAQPRPSLVTGLGLALVSVLWTYEGWQYVSFTAGETREPQRTFPRGLVIGTTIVVLLYLLANVAYIAALGADGAARSERIAADAVTAVLGAGAGRVVAGVILVSIFSAANSLVLTTPRMYFEMAHDGVFFRKLGEVHARFGTPAVAIVVSSAISTVMALTGTFGFLLSYVIFTSWMFHALAAASVFVFRRREPAAARPFSVPGYPVTPALFILSAIGIVVSTIVAQPRVAALGILMLLSGVPVYYGWRALRARESTRVTFDG